MDLREKLAVPRPIFPQRPENFWSRLGKASFLGIRSSQAFRAASPFISRPAYQHHDPNISRSDPYLTTLHPTLAIDYFLSRFLGPLSTFVLPS